MNTWLKFWKPSPVIIAEKHTDHLHCSKMLVLKIRLSDKGVPLALQTKGHTGFEQISLQTCSRLSEWIFLFSFFALFPFSPANTSPLRSVCVSAL